MKDSFRLFSFHCILLVFILSCDKEVPNSALPPTYKCNACDSLKSAIARDPDLQKYLSRFEEWAVCKLDIDREYCEFDPSGVPRDQLGRSYATSFGPGFDVATKETLNNYYNRTLSNLNTHTYYSFDLTSDTPYQFPHWISFNYNESLPSSKASGVKHAFNPMYWDSIRNWYTTQGSMSTVTVIEQRRDTMRMYCSNVKLTIDHKLIKHPYMIYEGIVSADQETMMVTLYYFDTYEAKRSEIPTKIILGYRMKRYKK